MTERAGIKDAPWIESQWILVDGEVYARIESRARELRITPQEFLERVIDAILSGETRL